MNHYTGSVPDHERTNWRTAAECRRTDPRGRPLHDPNLWFPDGTTGVWLLAIEEAKRVCYRCPVMEVCGQWAREHNIESGVWGGLSEEDRRRIKRRVGRRAAPKPADADALVYTRTAPLTDACRELYDRYTEPRDGHLVWTGHKLQAKIQHRDYTYGQICFHAGHGRRPEGPVQRSCRVDQCVAPECLTDKPMRDARKRAARRKTTVTAQVLEQAAS